MTLLQRLFFICWGLVNTVFCMKYLPLPMPVSTGIGIGLTLSLGFLFAHRNKLTQFEKGIDILWWIGTIATVLMQVAILVSVDRMDIDVDRWSAIHYFWDAAFNGEFPYAVFTHIGNENTPSPLPVWQVLLLPFYLLGDVGILQPTIFIALSAVIYRVCRNSIDRFMLFLLIVMAPAFWYETFTRSDLLSCMIVGTGSVIAMNRLGTANSSMKRLGIAALILGLLMSTRAVLAVPAAIVVAGISQGNPKRFFGLSLGAFPVFLLTLLPFFLWNSELFMQYNPLILNANKSVPGLIPVVLILTLFLGFKLKSFQWRIFLGGFLMFIVTVISLLWFLHEIPLNQFFSTASIDVAYLMMGLPFMTAAVVGEMKEKN